MKNYFGWIPSEEHGMGWIKKYCCWFPPVWASGCIPWKHHCSCFGGKVLYGATLAQGQWQWMLSRDSQLAWAAAHWVFLCPRECVDLANDNTERACPHWSPRPSSLFVLALFQAWMIALVEPSLSTRRWGSRLGGENVPFMGFIPTDFWIFLSVDLVEFYFLSVWKFGQKSQW